MSFRIEEKIICTYQELVQLRAKLKSRGMLALHPARTINSVYFDTRNHSMYIDSEEGNLPRKKIRIRSYGNDGKIFSLETKISSIEGRYKNTKSLSLTEAVKLNKDGIVDSTYGPCIPQISVRYNREYFEFERVRITFDTKISYSRHRSSAVILDPLTITEIKAPFGESPDFLETVIGEPRRRFSKFSRCCQFTKVCN